MQERFLREYDEHEYNPRTSEVLAQWKSGEETSMFGHEIETLYKTAKGNYFILSEGGLLSRCHTSPSPGAHGWYGGSAITPLTVHEARRWCEETGNYDTIDGQLFFPVENS